MTRPRLYLVRVQHADGRWLTWMRMCACSRDAIDWAARRWPDATGFAVQALRPRRPLAVLPRRVPPLAATGATAAFCGARTLSKGGVPVYAAPIYPRHTTATP